MWANSFSSSCEKTAEAVSPSFFIGDWWQQWRVGLSQLQTEPNRTCLSTPSETVVPRDLPCHLSGATRLQAGYTLGLHPLCLSRLMKGFGTWLVNPSTVHCLNYLLDFNLLDLVPLPLPLPGWHLHMAGQSLYSSLHRLLIGLKPIGPGPSTCSPSLDPP